MAATYTTSLLTEVDWIRYLTADTDVSAARLQDETLVALLTVEGNRWLAAAAALTVWRATATGPVIEKVVGDLRLRFSESAVVDSFDGYLKGLRERGAREKMPKPRPFAML